MVRVEFHCHTSLSFDATTSERELADACAVCGINAVTITEHDVFVPREFRSLRANGIEVVHGCEFTCGRGAHIIGLFLDCDLQLSGQERGAVVSGIRAAGGLVYLPHPFKPASGYFTQYAPDSLLDGVDMMELYNGGFPADPNLGRIRELATAYRIRLVAGSDSHAVGHVGFYVSEYDVDPEEDLRDVFRNRDPRLLVDESRVKAPRELNWVQRRAGYQWLVTRVPNELKRPVKTTLARVAGSMRGRPRGPVYRPIV